MRKATDVLEFAPEREREAAREVAKLVRSAGGRAYIVGGAVRDALLGRPVNDLDIEAHGVAPDVLVKALKGRFSLNLVGVSFGVIKLSGVDVDVSTPRRENKTGAGHRGFLMELDPGMTVEEASARRDFTVNAIMYDMHSNTIVDPHGGVSDLREGILRHVSEHFREDPLRVLRGMQFVARFGFAPAAELLRVCRTMSMEGLAVERVAVEWKKMLVKGVKPSLGMEFLRKSRWLENYPELAAMVGCDQYPEWHPEGDVWRHTLHALDEAAKVRPPDPGDAFVFMLAVLCHDIGKPLVTVFEPDGRITSRFHDVAGEAPARSFLERITRDKSIPPKVLPLVREHMKPYFFYRQQASERAFRRLSTKVWDLKLLGLVAYSDAAGRPPMPIDPAPTDWFIGKVEELNLADGAPKPLVMGRHALALGVPPGPEMGRLLKLCYEAQLEGKITTCAEGLELLKALVGGEG